MSDSNVKEGGSGGAAANDTDVKVPVRRPPARPSFRELEPNPFEQSFASSKSSSSVTTLASSAPQDDDQKPKRDSKDSTTAAVGDAPKPVLPSLAALSSPSSPSYNWGMPSADLANSLRSGPLSPAMLAGPQQRTNSASHLSSTLNPFDASFGRTGLTPSTGLTPLVGGPVSFPPTSPNTAAFLAMVNSSGGPTAPGGITPNTLNAITNILNNANNSNNNQSSNNGPSVNPSVTTSATSIPSSVVNSSVSQHQPHPLSVSHVPSQQSYYPQVPSQNGNSEVSQNGDSGGQQNYPTTAATAASRAANGLFLLSQAHQELAKREEAQRAIDPAPVPSNNANNASARRGAKRNSSDDTVVPPKRPRTQSTRSKKSIPKASPSPEFDDMSVDEDEIDDLEGGETLSPVQAHAPAPNLRRQSTGASKKPETDEEKRKNFLERNRQAALKCRQRKKAWLAQLQAKVEFLSNENERLTNSLVSSREEISRLNAMLGGASTAAPAASRDGLPGGQHGHQPVSVSVSLAGAGKSIPAPVPTGRGYGY